MADWRAIPYARHGASTKADEGKDWDAGVEVEAADVDNLKKMCLFEDKDNLDNKAGYKGPHHTADGNKVVWRGVAAAMAVLQGARGGFEDVPKVELAKGYRHLIKHYKQFDKSPPSGGKFEGMKVLD